MKTLICLSSILMMLSCLMLSSADAQTALRSTNAEFIFDEEMSEYVVDVDGLTDSSRPQQLENAEVELELFVIKHLLFLFIVGFACSPLYYEALGSYFGCGYFGAYVTYAILFLLDADYRPLLLDANIDGFSFLIVNLMLSVVGGFGGMLMYSLPMNWKKAINPVMYTIRNKLFKDWS